MASAVQIWLVILAIFEFVSVGRTLIAAEDIKEIQWMHASGLNKDAQYYWVAVATMLAVIRLGQAAAPHDAALWRVTAIIHSLEVLFYGWWIFVLDRSVPTDFAKINAGHAKPLAIYGIVAFNALWFLQRWWSVAAKVKLN